MTSKGRLSIWENLDIFFHHEIQFHSIMDIAIVESVNGAISDKKLYVVSPQTVFLPDPVEILT